MMADDPESFTKEKYKFEGIEYTDVSWWKYGKEVWCNLEGQYTTIVADLSGLTGSYEMSLCNIGIMGTKYVRTG